MRYTQTTVVIGCDRCDTRVLESENAWGWLVAQTALSESPTATVTYHLCPACREALGTFMANEPPMQEAPLWHRWRPSTDEFRVRIIRRLNADEVDPEVGPMFEVAAHAFEDELTWQIEGAPDAFEAYRAERERLGL